MIDLHNRIIEKIFQGLRNADIAMEFQISEDLVSKVRNSDAGKYKLARMQAEKEIKLIEVEAEIEALSKQAIVKLGTILTDETTHPKVQVQVAQDLLDRAGFGAVKKTATVSTVLTASDIKEIKERSKSVYYNEEKH